MSEKYKQIVKEVDASFSENNIEGFFKHCSENIEWEMAGEGVKRGIQEIREWMDSMPKSEPPKINRKALIAENDRVAAYGDMTMKNEKGEDIAYDYCDIYRFENDKIVELISIAAKTGKE